MISIIRIRAALFENERDLEQSTQALVPPAFENPSFHEEDDLVGNVVRCRCSNSIFILCIQTLIMYNICHYRNY